MCKQYLTMKIVNILPYFSPFLGGAEIYAYRLSKNLVELGHEVEVHCSKHKNNLKNHENMDGIEIFRHKTLFNLKTAPFFMCKCKGDIYHSHFPFPTNVYTSYINKKRYKRPFVLTYYNDLVGGPMEKIYHTGLDGLTVNMADNIITPTTIYIENSRSLKKYKKKINIIPIGIDEKTYNTKVSGNPIRKRFKIKDKMILFVGVLSLAHKYKGVDYLIKAMKNIVEERKKTKLIINGTGAWKKELVDLTNNLKLEDNVIFVDKFNNEKEKVQYFRACDVLVLPSINKSEGFGIVSLEAMACGKPVIGSNVGGIPFVLGDVGLLTKPKDIDSLSTAILKVLNDDKLARRMGKASRKRVEKHFTIRKAAEKTEKVFESLI